MGEQWTQPASASGATRPFDWGVVDPADKLYAVVKAFNTRRQGRMYPRNEVDGLFEALKLFNARRHHEPPAE